MIENPQEFILVAQIDSRERARRLQFAASPFLTFLISHSHTQTMSWNFSTESWESFESLEIFFFQIQWNLRNSLLYSNNLIWSYTLQLKFYTQKNPLKQIQISDLLECQLFLCIFAEVLLFMMIMFERGQRAPERSKGRDEMIWITEILLQIVRLFYSFISPCSSRFFAIHRTQSQWKWKNIFSDFRFGCTENSAKKQQSVRREGGPARRKLIKTKYLLTIRTHVGEGIMWILITVALSAIC